ncbi:MAG TPA: pit accessory protein [Candidatus Binatia bacterium]|nr:pit accessory protein [Candidatus Binatia bacterium]
MFTVQKIFSKDDKFYELLEASAEESRNSVQALNRVLAHPDKIPSLTEFHQSKEADKRITEQISEALIDTFVADLEREDIEALSEVLYKIPKTVEKFAERFIVSARIVRQVKFNAHMALLETATNTVTEMVKQLRKKPTIEFIKGMNAKLQKTEAEADDLIISVLQDLYSGKHDGTTVLALKDLYELLEKVIDRCRDAGNVVTHIVLKSS